MPTAPWAPVLSRRRGSFVIRLAVTVAVFAVLLSLLPLDRLLAAVGSISPWRYAAVLAGFGAGHIVAAMKWRLLLKACGVGAGTVETLRAHGAGLFANFCLPSLVGGDMVRAGLLLPRHRRAEALAVAGIADRLLDTTALVALATAGGVLAPGGLGPLAQGILGLTATALLLALLAAPPLLARLDPARLPARVGLVIARLQAAAAALCRRPGTASTVLGLAIAIQSSFVLLNVSLGRAVGIELPWAIWFLAWPLAKLAALLPVSLGGLGVREAALAALLAPFGVELVLAVAQSVLWETVLLALGLVAGAAALWWLGSGPRTDLQEDGSPP